MKKIIISYFPTPLKYVAPPVFGVGIYILTIGYPIWAVITTLVAIILLTTNYVTEINLVKKEYRDYLSFLSIPFEEEKGKFNSIEKIIILKKNHSQMLNSRSRSRQLDWESFTGMLLFDNNRTLDLLTKNNKGELIKGLKEFSDSLKVSIEDRSTNRHYIVDTTRL